MGDHFYDPVSREPRHFVEKKDGSGTRPSTIADARKQGWLPSVTTILKVLAKPALTEWLQRNAATAALTTPRIVGETLDEFLERILRRDAVDEARRAKDLGSRIHEQIETWLNGHPVTDFTLTPFVDAVGAVIKPLGRVVWTERILIGDGYAGKSDALFESEEAVTLVDFKTAGKVPERVYPEHELQLAAYTQTLGNTGDKRTRTAIVYISTKEPGLVTLIYHDDWQQTYTDGFVPVVKLWQWMNNYAPVLSESKENQ